jgi:N-methylhydantoinase A
MELDAEAARTAVAQVAEAIGLSVDEAAEGILKIVNENMAGALRVISVQRGHDPRDFALVAFGGAGPLHANAVAELMGSFPVIVPPSPGLLCALGDLVADFRNEFAQTLIRLTSSASDEEVGRILSDLEGRARAWMDAQAIAPEQQSVAFVADMRYHGQGYEIPVPMERDVGVLDERFNGLHERLYGFRMPDTPSEIVNLRAIGAGARPSPELPHGESEPCDFDASGAIADRGEILFEGERRPTPIYDRGRLAPGHRLTGPAVITEFDSTTVVLPGYAAEVDAWFNVLIRPEEKGSA